MQLAVFRVVYAKGPLYAENHVRGEVGAPFEKHFSAQIKESIFLTQLYQ